MDHLSFNVDLEAAARRRCLRMVHVDTIAQRRSRCVSYQRLASRHIHGSARLHQAPYDLPWSEFRFEYQLSLPFWKRTKTSFRIAAKAVVSYPDFRACPTGGKCNVSLWRRLKGCQKAAAILPSKIAARCTLHVARCTLHVARCTLHVARCALLRDTKTDSRACELAGV